MNIFSAFITKLKTIAEFGASNSDLQGRESLRKRVLLVNFLSLAMFAFTACSFPFDMFTAPRWMLAIDLFAFIFLALVPILNRKGFYLISRLLFFLGADAVIFLVAYFMGLRSGAYLVMFGLVAFGMVLFEINRPNWLMLLPILPIVQFFYFIHRESPPPDIYLIYSAASSFIFLCTSVYFLIITTDRMESELKLSRANAIFSEKMASLGEMSSGVAHEINTPLTVMQLNLHLLQRKLETERGSRKDVDELMTKIEKMVGRISDVTHAMQKFSRTGDKDPSVKTAVDVIIAETLEICRQRFKKHKVDLIIDPIPSDAHLLCRPVEISQVLLNLLNNALQAVSLLQAPWVRIRTEADGSCIRIVVTDSGPGVPEPLREKIFEPFFTTKPPGQGTGLGLSVSKGIIESHNGRLYISSDVPNTEFVMEFSV